MTGNTQNTGIAARISGIAGIAVVVSYVVALVANVSFALTIPTVAGHFILAALTVCVVGYAVTFLAGALGGGSLAGIH